MKSDVRNTVPTGKKGAIDRGYRRRHHGRDGRTRSTEPARGDTRGNLDRGPTQPACTRGNLDRGPTQPACRERFHALGRHRGMGDHC